MHRHEDGTLVVSATDLVGFLACDHLATLELGKADGMWQKPPRRTDPELQLLQERGDAFERAYLERRRAAGASVVEIPRPENDPAALRAAEADTVAAMRRGVDLIYQATFFDGRWLGYADFLQKVDRPSPVLGPWSYEVADTKLARAVKGGALLQVCVYSDRLAQLQGVAPENVHVVTGDGTTNTMRLDDYAAFFRTVKRRFEREVFGDETAPRRDPASAATYPDPVEHCRVCAWFPTCIQRRRDDDHLSIVAGMTRAYTERLMDGGLATMRALAVLPPTQVVPEMNARPLGRVREQARLQVTGADRHELLYELIEPFPDEPGKGLALLPEPSPLDVFFDIEADPWAIDDGLEYLLGVVTIESGVPSYLPLWGHDRAGEKAAFEAFIDLVIARLERDPTMHVYHYAGYESGAIKRLMQRHATREDEVDRLLRGKVLVDLFQVVRQGVRASVESYSLKKIEKFYLPVREGPITEAGFSVVEYENWRKDQEQRHLDDLAAYNRDDCASTWQLRDWLEDRRREGMARGWELPRPILPSPDPTEAQTERQAITRRRIEALQAGVPADPADRSAEQQGRWLLSLLLEWHRRDNKPQWWNWYRLSDLSTDELIEDREALGGLEFVGRIQKINRSVVLRYRFPPQDHKFDPGDSPIDPLTKGGVGTVYDVDDARGTIDLKRSERTADQHPTALIPSRPIPVDILEDALGRLADWVLANGIDASGPWRASRDIILKRPPRVAGDEVAGELRRPVESVTDAARRLALELDGGTLAIQGPPGTGKTYTGARMILDLVRAGRKVGIAAQSHKAITNMLMAVDKAAREEGRTYRAMQKCGPEDGGAQVPSVTITGDANAVGPALRERRIDIAAGTAWQFARPEMQGTLDVLVVDEAGQMSLANVAAMNGAARSIVLLGDPNQLAQVSTGVHPDGAGASALEHLVGSALTVPPDLGLFLDRSYRLHPAINAYISEVFYDRRLGTDESTARQAVDGWAGLRWRPVEHSGDDSDSPAEAAAVAAAFEDLLGRTWTDQHGVSMPLTARDILVVAPYNAHVAAIERAVEARVRQRARVGTVDKFQGQEGAVAIYSMASSSAEDAPRGMDFLYERNRLNVAISRARAVAILVASPRLLEVHCQKPEQMAKANALCRYVELATS
ncbi:MAG: TM0106 family RecB-like putative nuclease [Candidatus Limnocylindrales bacterium]